MKKRLNNNFLRGFRKTNFFFFLNDTPKITCIAISGQYRHGAEIFSCNKTNYISPNEEILSTFSDWGGFSYSPLCDFI